MLNRFLRRRPAAAESLDQQLRAIDEQICEASAGYETQHLNRAGDLCAAAGNAGRALSYYGRAIDIYLESGRYEAAEALCRKVLRLNPDAVRPHCTLAWISLGKAHREGAEQAVADYVRAASRTGEDPLAAKQLRMMAEAAHSPELRESLADWLISLGDDEGADTVLGTVYAERNGVRPAAEESAADLWASLLAAALMGPGELRPPAPEPEFTEIVLD